MTGSTARSSVTKNSARITRISTCAGRRKWNYTAALNYAQDFGSGSVNGRVSYNWRDDYEGTVSNFPGTRIESYGLLDASLSYKFKEWRIGVFGRNLTDEDAYQHTFVVAPNSDGSSLFQFANPRPSAALRRRGVLYLRGLLSGVALFRLREKMRPVL